MMRRQKGYTLIVAVLVLVVIATLAFVFLGFINRNIQGASQERRRSAASDLSLAGVRYSHSQLLYSEFGADWRGAETPPASAEDPDYDYLKPGGPDGLGFYTRLQFNNGRALVRVRYAPSDAAVFQTSTSGPLRQPGMARNYLMIESVGRSGKVVANDPTQVASANRGESKKLIAFASIGIIESARFITNKDRVSRPAEIGVPTELGAVYNTTPVAVPQVYGVNTTYAGETVRFGGSLYSNADLKVYGGVEATLNKGLGDAILVNGVIAAADATASLEVTRTDGDDSDTVDDVNVTLTSGTGLNSRDSDFTTIGGVFRDAIGSIDPEGWPRSVARKDPPSIQATDPNTGLNRYVTITRESGQLLTTGYTSKFGHGKNVYVNNLSDRQLRRTEDGRESAGSGESLVYDWLNPNNGLPNSGWQGPYYVPVGAFVEFTYDGFLITRDSRGPVAERTWRNEDGTDSGLATIRFRIGSVDPDGGGPEPAKNWIVNTLTPGVAIDGTLTDADYTQGFEFDGVLFFEGNVRTRGAIPTNLQITLVSMGTIYIEGSLTKGERSMLALLAKEYVTVNTTQFFGPALNQTLEPVNDTANPVSWHPVRVKAATGTLNLRHEYVRDPATGDLLAYGYREFDDPNADTGTPMDVDLLLTHTMDDGAASNAFFSLDVNFGLGATPTYQFELSTYNAATPYYPSGTTYAPIYGLGDQAWQRYTKFESQNFPFIQAGFTDADPELEATGDVGAYRLLMDESNYLTVRANNVGTGSTNDYLLARAALLPHDIRIEATIFAEDGSFFVIPGHWFNPDPNDRRDLYAATGATAAEREDARRDDYGAFPMMPFYGEPPDIRIQIVGSISENMPPPISQQAEWLKKWGWIPRELGATGRLIPWVHVTDKAAFDAGDLWVPNLTLTYDLDLATGKSDGFDGTDYLRVDQYGRALAPMPRLPVSPTLAYFGEVVR